MGQINVEKNVGGIEGLCVITPAVHGDSRGYFMETYSQRDMEEAGIDITFVQDNQSMSTKGVLRGLHFQKNFPQTKLVRVIKGSVFDVAVDLRSESETYGKWYGIELTADTLRNGAASGHYYENYVVMELVKNYAYAKSKVNITYFRDSNAKEIDVFIEENNVIHPLEIKKSASPDRREVKKYSVIDKASLNRGNGGIICMCEEPIPIDKDNCFIPSNLI